MANVYEYDMIDRSPTMAVTAGEQITGAPCKAVKLSGGKAVLPAAGEAPMGILLLSSDEILEEGAEAIIQVMDRGRWKAGGSLTAGDLLASDAEGLCQKAASGQYVYARALADAVKGDLAQVQIINAGYMAGE